MALELKVARTLIGSTGETVSVTDDTGDYNAATNITGWGAPNEVRADFGLILFVVEKSRSGDVVVETTLQAPASATPITVTEWRFTNNIGGWYEYYMLAAHKWDAIETWALGELCYAVAQDAWYKSLQAGNNNNAVTDGAWWEVLDDSSLTTFIEDFRTAEALEEVNDNDLLLYVAYDDRMDMITYNVNVPINRLLLLDDCGCTDICELSEYTKARIKYYALMIHYSKRSYVQAQSMYERLYRELK